jgi:hypothetical protein
MYTRSPLETGRKEVEKMSVNPDGRCALAADGRRSATLYRETIPYAVRCARTPPSGAALG